MKNYLNLNLLFAIVLLLCCTEQKIFSQTIADYTNLKLLDKGLQSAPPTVSTLMKYVDAPVSYSTGIPNISVPIYTIKSKELELPLSISYHARGIKVDDESSDVGLGWSLIAGGCITRIVKGKVDDEYIRWRGVPLKNRTEIVSSNDESYLLGVRMGDNDTEYDRFVYNFCGITGSFYCMKDGVIFQYPLTDRKIDVFKDSVGIIKSFIITTPDGIKYHFTVSDRITIKTAFESKDVLDSRGSSGDGREDTRAVSSWYISKIINYNSTDSITFEYEAGIDWSKRTHQKVLTTHDFVPSILEDRGSFMMEVTHYQNIDYTYCKILKTIKFNGGKVLFHNVQDRLDKVSPSRICDISVINSNNIVIQTTFLDNLSYFSCGRMKLSSITTVGQQNEILDKNDFTYFENYTTPRNPSEVWIDCPRPYYGQDEFGYYNGVTSNNHLVSTPIIYGFGLKRGPIPPNRSYSFEYAKNLTLCKIKNHLGNETEFIYEPNKYSDKVSIGLRIQKIITYDNNRLKKERFFEYNRPSSNFNFLDGAVYTEFSGSHAVFLSSIQYAIKLVKDVMIFPIRELQDSSKVYDKKIAVGEKTTTFTILLGEKLYSYPERLTKTNYPTSILPGAKIEDAQIFYGLVSEIITTPENEKVKVDYEYENPINSFHSTSQYTPSSGGLSIYTQGAHLIPGYYIDFLTPSLLASKTTYKTLNNEYIPVEKVVNTYKTYDYDMITTGIYVKYNDLDEHDLCRQPLSKFYFFDLQLPTERRLLSATTTTKFYDNGNISECIEYKHNPIGGVYNGASTKLKNELVKSVNYRSNYNTPSERQYIHVYRHPEDINESVYQSMLSQNCISPTISEELFITDNQVVNLFRSKLNTKYSFVNKGNKNMILPLIKELRFEQSEGIPCKNFISYNLYSDNGRPLQISSNSNPTCVYLWGYGSKYPIAKIENATYAEIESKLGLYQLIDIENSPTFSETQQNLINSLRSSLPKAMVTTYLYEPLVGLITIIDPSGRSKTFEYDKGNRLQGIYDEDKNILEAFEYHYKK